MKHRDAQCSAFIFALLFFIFVFYLETISYLPVTCLSDPHKYKYSATITMPFNKENGTIDVVNLWGLESTFNMPTNCWSNGYSVVYKNPTDTLAIFLLSWICGAFIGMVCMCMCKSEEPAVECLSMERDTKCILTSIIIPLFLVLLIATPILAVRYAQFEKGECDRYTAQLYDDGSFTNRWCVTFTSGPLQLKKKVEYSSSFPLDLPQTCWYKDDFVTFYNPGKVLEWFFISTVPPLVWSVAMLTRVS